MIELGKYKVNRELQSSEFSEFIMVISTGFSKYIEMVFKRYPNPKAYLRGRLKTQQNMLKPLGMWSVRAKRLRQMSKEYLMWDGKEASDLHGIGKYGSDSYKIFYKNEIPEDVQDKELKRYVEQL